MATQTQTAPNNDAGSKPQKTKTHTNTNSSAMSTNMRCPDPSAHDTKSSDLQNQASAAALYSTNPANKGINPLGPDNKLSSASAATSLKYARAQDLPSFPVVGIDTQSSAGAAANLANANTKSPEWWKPGQSSAAGKAALLANDYKMAPLWQPEASSAGSKAALLAHKDGAKLDLWTPEASSAGNSAANIAFRKKTPPADTSKEEDVRKRALMAATGAVSTSRRARSSSTPAAPASFPDSANSARNALSAATLAHRPSVKSPPTPTTPTNADSNRMSSGAMEAARIQHSKSMSRQMYTERPPVALEVEEQNRQNALRASAISMAKTMYDVQQRHIDEAAGRTAAKAAHGRQPSTTTEADIKQQALQYIGIQEAAQKLAAERLAKIEAEHESNKFQSYYGYDKPKKNRLSIRRGRGRASSDPEPMDDSSDDEFQSRRIRNQMNQFNKTLAEVDAKKRDQDRRNLMAAAERKVQAQMHGIDKKIFDETGKMSPAMIEEWDAKARAKAAADSEARMVHHGKIHVGGGKFLDQSEIDAVAAARIQPTLDEINEKTEKQRAKDEEIRLDQEEKKRQAMNEKQRAAELKAEEKRIKDEEKQAARNRTAEEKAAAKQEKEAEKAKRAEEKRMQKEEKRKSKGPSNSSPTSPTEPTIATSPTSPTADAGSPAEGQNDDLYSAPEPTSTQPASQHDAQEPETTKSPPPEPTSPTSPTSPTKSDSKGFKSLFSKLKRRKHSAAQAEIDQPGFIGGASLRASSRSNPPSEPQSPSIANNQFPSTATGTQTSGIHHSPSISSLSSDGSNARGRVPQRTASGLSAVSGQEDFEEARDGFNEELAPPPSFGTDASAARKGSPNRDSRFHEIGI